MAPDALEYEFSLYNKWVKWSYEATIASPYNFDLIGV